MKIEELKNKISDIKNQIKPLKKELAKYEKQLQETLDNDKFSKYSDKLAAYYSFKLPDVAGDNLYDLIGYNSTKFNNEFFDGYEFTEYRSGTFDVAEEIFEVYLLERYCEDKELSDVSISLLFAWDTKQYPEYDISDLPKEDQQHVINFIDMFITIKCNTCVNDW